MAQDRFTTLIRPGDLQAILSQGSTVVFDVRFSLADPQEGSQQYAQGHIPGAMYLHLDHDLSGEITSSSGRHPLPDPDTLAETLRACGVHLHSQVVAYDQGPGAFAGRLWWLCKWLGHEAVAVLDGGMAAWQGQGLVTDRVIPTPSRGDFQAQRRDELQITTPELEQGMNAGGLDLCDARAPERFRGEVEPIDKVAGHIPGARNLPFMENLAEDGTFLPAARLAERHSAANKIVHMCGSGVTACHNILAALVAGQPMPRLYTGSWSEWITDPKRGVATGEETA